MMDNCSKRRRNKLNSAWQGREYSHATGLYSFRARWYDPAAGRWLSKDPIGLDGGFNLYEAFGNNPVCFRDPRGTDRYLYSESGWNVCHWEAAVDTWENESGTWERTGTIRFGFQFNPDMSVKGGLITEHDVSDQEFAEEFCKYKRIPSTPKEDIEMLIMIKADQKTPFDYSLLGQNCIWWAKRALKYGKGDYR